MPKKKEEKTKESGLRKDQRSTHTYTNIHTHKKKKDQVVEKKNGPKRHAKRHFLVIYKYVYSIQNNNDKSKKST